MVDYKALTKAVGSLVLIAAVGMLFGLLHTYYPTVAITLFVGILTYLFGGILYDFFKFDNRMKKIKE